ncbi:MAG: T9SS type A sorting domain-containing protein, partial [Burkholderiales bacterium]|nr:T9SS type A sorting domain-containing protein [Flavobacterium sp.]
STPGAQYKIEVATYQINGAWVYGDSCTITLSSTFTRYAAADLSVFDVKSYPNPFNNSFKLDINTSKDEPIELKVYDLLGRAIENRSIVIDDLNTQEIGEGYTSGVYTVIVKQGENSKTFRMIKR